MRIVTSFPEQYALVHQKVAELKLYYPLSEEDDDPDVMVSYELTKNGFKVDYRNYDFSVTLRDGRSFIFTACTPDYVRDFMEREGEISFVESGLLLVREVSLETMLDALEKCLEKEELYGLEHFGIRAG